MISEATKRRFLWFLAIIFLIVAVYLIIDHLSNGKSETYFETQATSTFRGPTAPPHVNGPVGLPPSE